MPAMSGGLTRAEVERTLAEHGPNGACCYPRRCEMRRWASALLAAWDALGALVGSCDAAIYEGVVQHPEEAWRAEVWTRRVDYTLERVRALVPEPKATAIEGGLQSIHGNAGNVHGAGDGLVRQTGGDLSTSTDRSGSAPTTARTAGRTKAALPRAEGEAPK